MANEDRPKRDEATTWLLAQMDRLMSDPELSEEIPLEPGPVEAMPLEDVLEELQHVDIDANAKIDWVKQLTGRNPHRSFRHKLRRGIATASKLLVEWVKSLPQTLSGKASLGTFVIDVFRLSAINFVIVSVIIFVLTASSEAEIPVKEYNINEGFTQLQASARNGDVLAQFSLGSKYQEGNGVEQSESQAAEWYIKAAQQGHVEAQYRLGKSLIKQSKPGAMKWLCRAADQGHADARVFIATLYKRGDPPVGQSDTK